MSNGLGSIKVAMVETIGQAHAQNENRRGEMVVRTGNMSIQLPSHVKRTARKMWHQQDQRVSNCIGTRCYVWRSQGPRP